MTTYSLANILSQITTNLLSNFATRSSAYRTTLSNMASSYLNLKDGGNVIEALTGYSSTLTPSDDKHLTPKKYVDDQDAAVAAAAAAAIASVASDVDNKQDKLLTTTTQTAHYTLVLADAGSRVRMNVGSANNLTVPTNAAVAYPIGTQILIQQIGAGQTTIVPDTGVTINSYNSRNKISGQYGVCTLIKDAADTWTLEGNLTT